MNLSSDYVKVRIRKGATYAAVRSVKAAASQSVAERVPAGVGRNFNVRYRPLSKRKSYTQIWSSGLVQVQCSISRHDILTYTPRLNKKNQAQSIASSHTSSLRHSLTAASTQNAGHDRQWLAFCPVLRNPIRRRINTICNACSRADRR